METKLLQLYFNDINYMKSQEKKNNKQNYKKYVKNLYNK